MKKIFCVLLSIVFILPFQTKLYANYMFTESKTESVSGGINYEQRNILTENGWIKAYIAYIDLSNPNAAVKVLTSSKGSSYLSTVKQMAADNGANIAVNGDFFNFSSSQTNMIGMTYKDGKLISSPSYDNMVSFALTDNNDVLMDYFTFSSKVISPQGYECPIYQINKIPVDTGAVTMLTSDWSGTTWNGEKLKTVVVENDIVKEIREPGLEATAMPKNGYILLTNPEINGFFDNFAVGDTVTVDTKLSPDNADIKEATGGNTMIVNDGKICKFTSNISGYAQRSSVGVSEDGKTLMLVATDGRQTDCRGLTQTELAQLMISLGAHRAINLDGGGSTTFVKKEGSDYSVKNSVSSQRSVSTSIGVFANNLKGEDAVRGEAKCETDVMLVHDNTSMNLTFFDKYNNVIDIDKSLVTYYDDNWNIIENGTYESGVPGVHTIYAKYKEITLSSSVDIIDDLVYLELNNTNIELGSGAEVQLGVTGYDAMGRKFSISPSLVNWTASSDKISVSKGLVTASEGASGYVSAEYKGKEVYASVNKSISKIKAPLPISGIDPMMGEISADFSVAVSGNVPKGATLLNKYFALQRLDELKKYSLSYFMENYYSGSLPSNGIVVSKYTVRTSGSTNFLTINTSGGVITTADWINLCYSVLGTSKNVVIISQNSPERLNETDGKRLKNLLKQGAGGRNIFYVSESDVSGVKMEDGVRYLTCGTVSDYKKTSYESDKNYCSYVLFLLSGDELKYKFVAK